METRSTRVLVAGATGYLGRFVTAAFAQRRYQVDALSRSASAAERLAELGANPVVAQATESDSLAGRFEGVDVVVSSLGITRQKDGLTYEDVDYQANCNLLRAAEQAGVARFVYVSVFGAEELSHTAMVRAKERFVGELRESPIQSLVVRPTGFFSDLEEVLGMARKRRVWVFGRGDQQMNPIAGEDLAEVIADAVDSFRGDGRDGTHHAELAVGGPETLTMRQIAETAFAAIGRNPRISSVPMWAVGLLERVLPRVTPVAVHGPIQFFLAVSQVPMVAPGYGSRRLADHYERVEAESS